MRLHACGGERSDGIFGTRESKHLMAIRDEFLSDDGADETGGAGEENTHLLSPYSF
jgi:hypothetical protein